MLEKILLIAMFIVAVGVVFWFGYIVYLMWRFVAKSELAYELFKTHKNTRKWPTKVYVKNGFSKVEMEFTSSLQMIKSVKDILNEALQYYKRLGNIAYIVQEISEEKAYLDFLSKELEKLK